MTIVYIRTHPKTCLDRLRKRSRSEESNISLEYLFELHEAMEDWLVQGNTGQVIVIDGDRPFDVVYSNLHAALKTIPHVLEQ